MLLSCAIWTVSTFFLWSFLPTVTTKQDVSQMLKEKGQRLKLGFCKRKGEKKNDSARMCWLRTPSWHWGKAAFLMLWSSLARSAIPRDWVKQTLAAPPDSVPFPFALPAASPGTTCPPNSTAWPGLGWQFAMYWQSHQQTSAELAGFYPC